MYLDDLMGVFNRIGSDVARLSEKYDFYKKEKSELNMDERFIYDELLGVLDIATELEGVVKYLNGEIVTEGMLRASSGRLFIGEYQIEHYDNVEFILDGDWVRTDISKVNGEYYIDLYGKRLNKDEIYARIRK